MSSEAVPIIVMAPLALESLREAQGRKSRASQQKSPLRRRTSQPIMHHVLDFDHVEINAKMKHSSDEFCGSALI
ncbi:hypothetical protein BDR06DRAFT_956700 [Suillus hirtellus]|nr:hypothetical protein BDR06DRAFT_956700 [Suillus hirtellus]